MLRTQQRFLQYCDDVLKIVEEIPEIERKGIEDLKNEITHQKLLIPVIGGFNVGKSTLINAFLGRNILPTAIKPETAIPAELYYSKDEYIEAIKEKGEKERFEIDDFEKIKSRAEEFKYLKVYLNNAKLKEIEPLILVDMPGFNAPIKIHQKAILDYLDRGVYFIALLSAEDGTLFNSFIYDLQSIIEMNRGVEICLNKTDLRTLTEVEEIIENLQKQIQEELGLDKKIYTLNKNKREKFEAILKSIDPEKLFYNLFEEKIFRNYMELESSINLLIAGLESGSQERRYALEELKRAISKIDEEKDNKISYYKELYRFKSAKSIAKKVIKALRSQEESLVNTALKNEQEFLNEANAIIRNVVLQEVKNYFQEINDSVIQDFQVSIAESFDLGGQSFKMDEFVAKFKHLKSGLERINDAMEKSGWKEKRGLYKAITTIISITTEVVNPVIEIIIVFLPEILDFILNNEERKRAKIKEQLHISVYPKIVSTIEMQLEPLLEEKREELIEAIAKNYQKILNAKYEELQKIETEQLKEESEIEKKIKKYENLKEELNRIFKITMKG